MAKRAIAFLPYTHCKKRLKRHTEALPAQTFLLTLHAVSAYLSKETVKTGKKGNEQN
jgi:hypothetical protein